MIKRKTKGQGALEYLMTYGWALLVIVVVAAALFALGVLNPSTYQQKRCNGFQYFTWMDQKISAGTGFSIQVRNSNQDIVVNGISVDGTSVGLGSLTISDNDIQEGDAFVISSTTDVTTKTSGSNYDNIAVIITYNVTGGISGNIDRATCVGTIE
jgi:hypothetical protein